MPKTAKSGVEGGPKKSDSAEKNVYMNRKARHEYFILNSFEAGIALVGSEVKSVRQGKISLQDSYAVIEDGEAYIVNMHISPYEKSTHFLPDPKRKRKLLLHKSEIRRLMGRVAEKGLTLIPLRVYLVRGRAKLEIALARGKPRRDRRYDLEKRDAEKEIRRQRGRRS
jgi:SsrA-binding protein